MTDALRGASVAELDARIARLADRTVLGDFAERYLASLDEGTFDDEWASSFFTEDIELTFPVGSHQGRVGAAAFTREIMERWDGTHHHGSPALVEIDADRATVAWSLIASHLHFDSPGRRRPRASSSWAADSTHPPDAPRPAGASRACGCGSPGAPEPPPRP